MGFAGAALKQDFTANAGDVLRFQWNFLTDDGPFAAPVHPDASRDASFVTLTGPGLLFGSTLSNTLDQPSNSFPGPNPFLASSTPFTLETGFRDFSFIIPSRGDYTLGFGVVQSGLFGLKSGLLVDQVSVQAIPAPSVVWLFAIGGLALLGAVKASSRYR